MQELALSLLLHIITPNNHSFKLIIKIVIKVKYIHHYHRCTSMMSSGWVMPLACCFYICRTCAILSHLGEDSAYFLYAFSVQLSKCLRDAIYSCFQCLHVYMVVACCCPILYISRSAASTSHGVISGTSSTRWVYQYSTGIQTLVPLVRSLAL